MGLLLFHDAFDHNHDNIDEQNNKIALIVTKIFKKCL